MRAFLFLLLLLPLGACAAAPETPTPAASPTRPASTRPAPSSRVTLEKPGLWVELEQGGRLVVRAGEAPAEEWVLPEEVASQALDSLHASGLFGPASSPSEAGGALRVTFRQGDLTQVRAPSQPAPEFRALARILEDLVPGKEGEGPAACWLAGTLEFENLEGGLWKIRTGPDREHVLTEVPEGFFSGDRVRLTGRPAPPDQMGIHMAGPYYQVLTIRRFQPSLRQETESD
jgi:hypothetical protein